MPSCMRMRVDGFILAVCCQYGTFNLWIACSIHWWLSASFTLQMLWKPWITDITFMSVSWAIAGYRPEQCMHGDSIMSWFKQPTCNSCKVVCRLHDARNQKRTLTHIHTPRLLGCYSWFHHGSLMLITFVLVRFLMYRLIFKNSVK